MENEPPRSLLVLKPSSFGDIVHTLPAVARLKSAWPDCRISWVVNSEWMPLLAGNPDVDEVIEFPRREFRGWGGGLRFAKWLWAQVAGRKPDLALDFQGLLRSAVIGRASGTRALVGLSDAREGARLLYHRTVAAPGQPAHAVERYLRLADSVLPEGTRGRFGQDGASVSSRLPAGVPPKIGRELSGEFILLHPFARGAGKSMSGSEINEILLGIGTRQIVLVGRGEAEIPTLAANCLNLLNATTIPELTWLLRRAAFVVSVDSGPAHLAAALGTPMVAIHSWSDPRKVGPHRPDAWVWKNSQLVQVRDLAAQDARFFDAKPLDLRKGDLEAIAELAQAAQLRS